MQSSINHKSVRNADLAKHKFNKPNTTTGMTLKKKIEDRSDLFETVVLMTTAAGYGVFILFHLI
jgi:hypothetical protein